MTPTRRQAMAAALFGLAFAAQADGGRSEHRDERPVRANANISGCVDPTISGRARAR